MTDQELIQALREHAEWAAGNEWETPLMLGDDLTAAADRIANQNTHIAALQKAIEDLRAQLDIHRCAMCDYWQESDPRCMHPKSQWGGKTVVPDNYCRYWQRHTHWMPLPEPPEVHGRWEFLGPNRLIKECMCGTCSVCKVRSKYIVNTLLCPNCGAKMDGVSE